MCELLILTRSAGIQYAGDVVTIQADGWPWGRGEYGTDAAPFWRVVKLPGVPVSKFAFMLDPVFKGDKQILFRKWHFGPLPASPTIDDMVPVMKLEAPVI